MPEAMLLVSACAQVVSVPGLPPAKAMSRSRTRLIMSGWCSASIAAHAPASSGVRSHPGSAASLETRPARSAMITTRP